MVNKPLIRPYFWGGTLGGGRLTSHDDLFGPFSPQSLDERRPQECVTWICFFMLIFLACSLSSFEFSGILHVPH